MTRSLHLEVPDDVAEVLDRMAEDRQITMAELARRAFAQYAMVDKMIEAGALAIDVEVLSRFSE